MRGGYDTIGQWLRANLFRSPLDGMLTVLVGLGLAWCLYGIARWAVVDADWSIVSDNLRFLAVGTLPAHANWHAEIVGGVMVLLAAHAATNGAYVGGRIPAALLVGLALTIAGIAVPLRFLVWVGLGLAVIAVVIPRARRTFGQARLVTSLWAAGAIAVIAALASTDLDLIGGLLLSLLLTTTTAIASLPLGILLALGRRSRNVLLRVLCSAYIELARSLPLLLVVYWIWLMLPLLVPGWHTADIVRAGTAFALFVSAYVAEYIRTGLEAVQRGQIEAAEALGLRTTDINRYIVIPQALRTVFPALVGNVLEIFNAIPLLFIIGSVDLLRAGQIILSNPEYGANAMEMYLFVFIVYLAIGSTITALSRKIERRAGRAR